MEALIKYGWNPDYTEPAKDVAEKAAAPFEGRRFAVRIAPGLLAKNDDKEALARAIAATDTGYWKDLRKAIKATVSSEDIAKALNALDHANGKIQTYTAFYGEDESNCPRGIVFLAPSGLKGGKQRNDDSPDSTEDDMVGSLPGFGLSLQQHSSDVEQMAEQLARLAGFPEERVLDLKLAGYLHDAGKVDSRFQAWLNYGDPLGPDSDCIDEILAKSARPLPRNARSHSGLPENWRHEALSVRLAPFIPRFGEAKDRELVLWLIGTHHGHGRPLFPHTDPKDKEPHTGLANVLGIPSVLLPGHGPQSLAYDWNGLDWPSLDERLKARYGVWELAQMESVLRLADHRASEETKRASTGEGCTI